MRKIVFGILVALPVVMAAPVMALPGMPQGQSMQQAVTQDVIEVKGGHGHGWGRGHAPPPGLRLEPRQQGRLARPSLPAGTVEAGALLTPALPDYRLSIATNAKRSRGSFPRVNHVVRRSAFPNLDCRSQGRAVSALAPGTTGAVQSDVPQSSTCISRKSTRRS